MKVHFVCRGNTYRSRMAHAYLNSLNIPNWSATSSGIKAARNLDGHITTYADTVLTGEGILEYGAKTWTQSTKELLEAQDIVVFMQGDIYEYCKDEIQPNLKKYFVWDVHDIEEPSLSADEKNKIAQMTFANIKGEVGALLKTLEATQES